MTTEISESGFDAYVKDNANVIIDCWAPWCGPCRRLGPVIEEIAGDFEGKVAVAKLNVDDAPDVSNRYGISAIPTILMFKDGKLVKTLVGLRPKGDIVAEMTSSGLIPSTGGTKALEGGVAKVTDATFDSFVAGPGYALVDCWAPWCGPCRRMGPIVDGLAEISEGMIKVGKLDTDENQATAMRFNISSIPRLLIYKDGKLVDTIVGLDPSLTPENLKKHVLGQ